MGDVNSEVLKGSGRRGRCDREGDLNLPEMTGNIFITMECQLINVIKGSDRSRKTTAMQTLYQSNNGFEQESLIKAETIGQMLLGMRYLQSFKLSSSVISLKGEEEVSLQ